MGRVALEAQALVALARAGMFGNGSPQRLRAIAVALRDFGPPQLPADVATRISDPLGNLGRLPHTAVAWCFTTSCGGELPQVQIGPIVVGTTSPFEGCTGGGSKAIIDGLLSTGDVGHFDAAGRLYIDGRDDEMIVSGGENGFPREVEELLVTHPAITDAAAIGVHDDEFGQRLRAFVVVRHGRH